MRTFVYGLAVLIAAGANVSAQVTPAKAPSAADLDRYLSLWEKKMAEVKTLSVPIGYQAMKNGEIDVFLGNWMPAQKSFVDDLNAAKAAEVMTKNLEGAKFTLAVPSYMAEKGVKDFAATPGMPADVYIKTGQRTFFEYLLKPVKETMNRAFREP